MRRQSEEEIATRVCHACGERSMRRCAVLYEYPISHDGRPEVTISIPDLEVTDCTNPACPGRESGETRFLDSAATHRLTIETYRQLGLLTPDEIRAGREKLGMTQAELQNLLGLGGNSLSRWEKGRIYQARSMDTLLRLAFNVPAAMRYLSIASAKNIRSKLRYVLPYASQLGCHLAAPSLMKGRVPHAA